MPFMRIFFAKVQKVLSSGEQWPDIFWWKVASVLVFFLAALASPAEAHIATHTAAAASGQEDIDDTEAFFRREKEAQVPIIMYHLVTERDRYVGKYGIRPSELERDLKYLKENDYNTVVMQDLIDFVENGKRLPKKPIVLTFDDGYSSDYNYLFPLLKEYKMKAVISIIGKAVDESTQEYEKNPAVRLPHLTWAQVAEMHKDGRVEVQSHGYDVHGRAGSGKLRRESTEAYHRRLAADLQKLQDRCQEYLDYQPNTFCYPLGVISKESYAVLEELGFKASLSCQEGINIIKQGEKNCLIRLNRNNRPNGRPIEDVLADIYKDAEKKTGKN